jgi:hypothetical protein
LVNNSPLQAFLYRSYCFQCSAVILRYHFHHGYWYSKERLHKIFISNSFFCRFYSRGSSNKTVYDVPWITNRIVQLPPFQNAASAATTCVNFLAPRHNVFAGVCDWNLIMTTDSHPYNELCNATNAAFNI